MPKIFKFVKNKDMYKLEGDSELHGIAILEDATEEGLQNKFDDFLHTNWGGEIISFGYSTYWNPEKKCPIYTICIHLKA